MFIACRCAGEAMRRARTRLASSCMFVVLSAVPLFPQSRSLNRPYEPLVVNGIAFPSFSGNIAPLNELHLLAYRASGQVWEEIPFQIDPVEPDTAKDNLGTLNFFSPGDDLLDEDDQLVFLLADAGDRAPANNWPADSQARSYPRYEIEATDPLDGFGKAWVYLYRSSSLGATTADYLSYTPGPGNSPGADVISGLGYSEGHMANGIANSVIIPQSAGGSGTNFLDRWKLRLRSDLFPPFIVIHVNETNLVNLGVRVVDGKVRVLRELREEVNIGTPVDTAAILFKFYPYSQILSGVIKLTSQLKIGLLRQSFDFSPNAAGMTLFSHNGDSLRIDGQPDNVNTGVVLSPDINWAMATGTPGTFLNLFEVPAIGVSRTFYYRDAQSGTSDGTNDTGDGKSYGDNGLLITGTAITGDFRLALTTYYLPANQQRNVGAVLRERAANPVNLSSQEQRFDSVPPVAVRDLHVATSTASTVTLEWHAPSDAGSVVVSYQLAYSTTPIGSDTSLWFDSVAQKATNLPTPAQAGTFQSTTVAGLTGGARYFFILRSVDDFGNASAFSNVATIDAVPVELVAFTARAERNRVHLFWQTASETNNFGFGVERRAGSSEWQQVAIIPGHGTTTSPHTYIYKEDRLQPGTYSYRLKQIDTNGTFVFSEVLEVIILAPERFHLSQNYPNPFSLFHPAAGTSFQYELSEATALPVCLRIFNMLGQEVRRFTPGRQATGFYEILWDGRSDRGELVPGGLYFYELSAGPHRLARKLVVMR